MTIKKRSLRFIIALCIVLIVLTVSISMFEYILNKSPNEVIAQPGVIDDLRPSEDNGENNDTNEPTIEKPKSAYEIMTYAFSLLPSYENIVVTSTSSIGKNVLGTYISQDIKIKYQRAGKSELEEDYGHGFQDLYRYGYTTDGKIYQYLCIFECDENFNRDISGKTPKDTTKDEIIKHDQSVMFREYLLTPSKTIGTITSFDRISDDDFYIINFAVTNIPEDFCEPYYSSLNTKNVKFNSLSLKIYIEKSTYKIRLINRNENLTFDFKGLSITVGSQTSTTFKYPKHLELSRPV